MFRYRLVVNAAQDANMAFVTMFEDAAATFVGYSVIEYLVSIRRKVLKRPSSNEGRIMER